MTSTVVRLEQAPGIAFRGILRILLGDVQNNELDGFSVINDKIYWFGAYKVNQLQLVTEGNGTEVETADFDVPEYSTLRLGFELSRSWLEVRFYRHSFPFVPRPGVGYPQYPQLFVPTSEFQVTPYVASAIGLASPPTISALGPTTLVTFGETVHSYAATGDGYRLSKNWSNDQGIFRERFATDLTQSRWDLIKYYAENPPSGVYGFGWPVTFMQLAILMTR